MTSADDAPLFTDEERAQIAAEQDAIAAKLWAQYERAQAADPVPGLEIRLWNQACEAERLAVAARHSSAALARLY
ncbi:hypothetical protein ACFXD5_12010 [Streptomyces sp. NPDC059385]|uniref:hypothetical protein n=1 Tax=Streptomyces sp. NPDC059385 TaxID=3346817 RepID=UPI003689038D